MQNEPNLLAAAHGRAGRIVQNEANFTRAPGNGRGRPGPAGSNAQKMQNEPNFGGPIMQNEPNLWVKCAKRTQFAGSAGALEIEKCEMNPIPARQGDPMDLESATVCRPHPTGPATGQPVAWAAVVE
jgi:hypothetical protein